MKLLVIVIPFALTGCANDAAISPSMSLGGPAISGHQNFPDQSKTTHVKKKIKFKKTVSDRMLAASALERVTGRKPDPASFTVQD